MAFQHNRLALTTDFSDLRPQEKESIRDFIFSFQNLDPPMYFQWDPPQPQWIHMDPSLITNSPSRWQLFYTVSVQEVEAPSYIVRVKDLLGSVVIEFRWVLKQGPPSRELVFDTLGRMVGLNEPKLDPPKIWMSEDERNLEEERLERKRIKEKEEREELEKELEAEEQKGHLKTEE